MGGQGQPPPQLGCQYFQSKRVLPSKWKTVYKVMGRAESLQGLCVYLQTNVSFLRVPSEYHLEGLIQRVGFNAFFGAVVTPGEATCLYVLFTSGAHLAPRNSPTELISVAGNARPRSCSPLQNLDVNLRFASPQIVFFSVVYFFLS